MTVDHHDRRQNLIYVVFIIMAGLREDTHEVLDIFFFIIEKSVFFLVAQGVLPPPLLVVLTLKKNFF